MIAAKRNVSILMGVKRINSRNPKDRAEHPGEHRGIVAPDSELARHSHLFGGSLDSAQCPRWVCAVTRRRFPVGANPTRQPLQPEATGAVMEVTKWLKPPECVSRIGDSASVQAVTRLNAEQSPKRTMRRPTQPLRLRRALIKSRTLTVI